MVAGVIPAAGRSSRMRFPKAALQLGGASLIQLQCRALLPVVERLVVVVGWGGGLVVRGLPASVEVVRAEAWWRGSQLLSVQAALRGLDADRILIQPVDVPPPERAVLDRLLTQRGSAVPTWRGQRGHPVLLGPAELARIGEEPLPMGLRSLLADVTEVPVDDPRVCWNLNDARCLVRWMRAETQARPCADDALGGSR
jgi:CTP:molybdopterin cytidylyltransferase MocA